VLGPRRGRPNRRAGGAFVAVSAGRSHSCGLRTNAEIACWGLDRFGITGAPADEFTAVSAGGSHSCGLRINAAVACWGVNEHGETDAPVGAYIAVAAGLNRSCALRRDHTTACWGAVAVDLQGNNDT